MKTLTFISVFSIFISMVALGQEVGQPISVTKKDNYKSWYKLTSPKEKLVGLTIAVTDTSTIVAPSDFDDTKLIKYSINDYRILPYQRIITVKAQITNRAEWTPLFIVVFTSLGAGLGALIGKAFTSGGFEEAGIQIGACTGAASGIIIGYLIGTAKITIPINGSKDSFTKEKQRLEKYSVEKF